MAGPVVVLLAVLYADPWAALLLLGCGMLVPVGMAVAGIGAAAASRRQFLALARLQARFLDRVRGIATIVLYGRAQDEARALARAAKELRVRTMRVLRVAFLSSAVLDIAAALAMVVLAIHYFSDLRGASDAAFTAQLWPALAVLLLAPEFFAPLRTFSAAYQDKLHATGAAESLVDLPPLPQPVVPAAEIRTVAARGVTVVFDDVTLTWDPTRGPALDGLSFRAAAGETLVLAGPSGAGKSSVIEILLGFVRPDRRQGDDQRRRHHRPRAAGAVPPDRLDRPAARAVRRLDPRQHPVRPAGGHAGGSRRRRPRRPAGPVRRRAAAGPRHADRRGRLRPVRRPGAARRHRPGLSEERAAAAAGRADGASGSRDREGGAGQPAAAWRSGGR